MAGKMVPDEIGGGPEEANLIKAFGFYCLCVTDFKWVGEQDPIYSFKRSLWLLCGCTLFKKEKKQGNVVLVYIQ